MQVCKNMTGRNCLPSFKAAGVILLFVAALFVMLPLPAQAAEENGPDDCLALVNQERQAAGLKPLIPEETLTDMALVRAGEIVSQFSHTRPNGKDCFSLFEEQGISYRDAGENIAYNDSPSGKIVYEQWKNSPPHHENYMSPKFQYIGIGYVQAENGYYYWVQMFATPME